MLYFYAVAIHPVIEYAWPMWHSSLTAAQTKALESLQRRVMKIIFPDNYYIQRRLSSPASIRDTTRAADCAVFQTGNVLLPDKRDPAITDRLRHAKTFTSFSIKTEKFRKSFLPYCLNHFDYHLVWITCVFSYTIMNL